VLIHRTLANALTHARRDYDGRIGARSSMAPLELSAIRLNRPKL
jgi:hypothetical protein